jgi:hypothetical protein
MDFPIQVIRRVAVISWNFVLYQPENAHRIMWRKANGAQTQRDLPSGCVIRFLGSAVQPIHVPKAYSDSTTNPPPQWLWRFLSSRSQNSLL